MFSPLGPTTNAKTQRSTRGKSKQAENAKNKHKDKQGPKFTLRNAIHLILHVVLHGLALNIACANMWCLLDFFCTFLGLKIPQAIYAMCFDGMFVAYLLHLNVWKVSWDSPWIYLTPLIEIESEGRTQKFWYILNRT